jgi:hypothetical protein
MLMSHQAWIQELTAEIRELEELIAKAEQNGDVEGRWVVYLLKSVLDRRCHALAYARLMRVTKH